MKRKFADIPRQTITFYRDEEAMDFPLSALPLGYVGYLNTVFPAPTEFINGQPAEKLDAEYVDLWGYLTVARALEGSDVLETPPPGPGATRVTWDAYARAVRQEFADAHITSGEVSALMKAVADLDQARTKKPAEGGPGNS